MLLALVLGFIALAFSAYFLHLFFQLNKAERRLQETFNDVEAVMIQRYGRQKSKEVQAPKNSPKTDTRA